MITPRFSLTTTARRLARPAVAGATAAVLLTGCTVSTTGSGTRAADASGTRTGSTGSASGSAEPAGASSGAATHAPSHRVAVHGDSTSPAAVQAMDTISDLEDYWGKEMPSLYGRPMTRISGGYWSVDTTKYAKDPCADVRGNAHYCPDEDLIGWDSTGLLAEKKKSFGNLAVPVIIAHEWGHAVQQRFGFRGSSVTQETQADCFAGQWLRHAKDDGVLDVSDEGLNQAASAILSVKDPIGVTEKNTPNAHGNGFDRVNAFQTGYDEGGEACKAFRDGHPVVTEVPFTDVGDYMTDGNMEYDSVVNSVPHDLEDYWTRVYPEVSGGGRWKRVAGLKPYTKNSAPACDGLNPGDHIAVYCPSGDYVGWNDDQMKGLYDQTGDFGDVTVLAMQYAKAAFSQMGQKVDDASNMKAACYAGSYAASVILQNRKDTSSFTMSPGDLDEAVQTFLLIGGKDGFAYVRSYRTGVMDGVKGCAKLSS